MTMRKILFLCLLVSGGAWADDEIQARIDAAKASTRESFEKNREELLKSFDPVEQERRNAESWARHNERFSKPPAKIGMTESQVINNTYWGKPSRKNFTTTKYGTREQWVYDNVGYVYFEGGRVVAIQNY